jgi:hypothetical protein
MRLKMRVVAGIVLVTGMALSLPAATKDDTASDASGAKKPSKLSHLLPFHKSAKKEQSGGTLATAGKSEVRKHTNGFPEPDKKGAQYQPQASNKEWADDNWKTARNKDTFKQADSK